METSDNKDTRTQERMSSFSIPTTQSKRKLLTDQKRLVTFEELEKTRFSIQNPQHSKLAFEIMKKPHSQRFDEELNLLIEVFQDISFFQRMQTELDSETFIDLFRQLRAKTFRAGETVFDYDDWGEDFYIIIQGSVYILLKKQDVVAVVEEKPKVEPKHEANHDAHHARKHVASKTLAPRHMKDEQKHLTLISDTLTGIPIKGSLDEGLKQNNMREYWEEHNDLLFSEDATEKEQKEKMLEKKPHLFLGRVMKEGDSFGEIALQNRTRRTATVVCKEPTILGVLSRQQYKRILYKVYMKKDNEDLEFLKGIGLFSHMDHKKLREVFLQMHKMEVIKNKCIYQEGDSADRIYFIRDGDIEISQAVNQSELEEKNNAVVGPQSTTPKFKHKYFVGSNQETKSRVRKLSLLAKGHYFGLEEVLEVCPRKFTAKVVSMTAEVYYIEKEMFDRIVLDNQVLERAKEDARLRSGLQKIMISGLVKTNHFQTESIANHKKKLKDLGKSVTTVLTEPFERKFQGSNLSMIAFHSESSPYLIRASLDTYISDPLSPTSPLLANKTQFTADLGTFNKISSPKSTIPDHKVPVRDSIKENTHTVLTPKTKETPIIPENLEEKLESSKQKFGDYSRNSEYYKKQIKVLSPLVKGSVQQSPQTGGKSEKNNTSINEDLLAKQLSDIRDPNGSLEKRKKARRYLLERDSSHLKDSTPKELSPKTDLQKFRMLCKVLKIDKVVKKQDDTFGSLKLDDDNSYMKSNVSFGPELSSIFDSFRKQAGSKRRLPHAKDSIVTDSISNGLSPVLPPRARLTNNKAAPEVLHKKSPENSSPVLPFITRIMSDSSHRLLK